MTRVPSYRSRPKRTFEEVNGRLFPRRHVIPVDGGEPQASFFLPPGTDDLA